jgi:hypothetical protein
MASSTISPNYQFGQDREIWENLKKAIAISSGFKRWQEEQMTSEQISQTNLDEKVRLYLHETLATLAY